MKAIVKTKPEIGFELLDVETPIITSPDEVKLKTLKSSVCGTDLHIYNWDQWSQSNVSLPHINGHEVIAEIIEVGSNVKNFQVGEVVVCETHLHCGTCYQCRTGKAHICKSGSILGVDRDGIWCEYQVVPQNIIWKIGDIAHKYAGIMEPLGNAIHTLSYADLRGKHVLIVGAGPIGLMAAYVAKLSGASTITINEVNDYRIKMAQDLNIGLNIINPMTDNVLEQVNKITKDHGIDVAIEMSGNHQGLLTACELIIPGGQLNILSVYPDEKLELPLNDLVFKCINIQLVTGRKLFETWSCATEWLKYGILKPEVLDIVITHEFKMEDYDKAFEIMKERTCGKIILDFKYLSEE